MKRVLALDPGDKVGWARADIDAKGRWSNMDHGIEYLKPMALQVHNQLAYMPSAHPDYDIVICERWALYKHKAKEMVGSEIPSAQFIGMIKLSCWLAGVPLIMQDARDVNSHDPDRPAVAEASMKHFRPALSEMVTQPIAHDEGHDLVALKHLWLYTFKNYPVSTRDAT